MSLEFFFYEVCEINLKLTIHFVWECNSLTGKKKHLKSNCMVKNLIKNILKLRLNVNFIKSLTSNRGIYYLKDHSHSSKRNS